MKTETETLNNCCQKVKEDSDWSAGLAIHFLQRQIEDMEKKLAENTCKKIQELEKKLADAQRESFKTEVISLRRSKAGYYKSARYWRKRARIAEWEYRNGRKMTKEEQDQYEKRFGF